LNEYKHNVEILFSCQHTIDTEGIASSPLKLLGSNRPTRIEDYVEKFKGEIYSNHYRKIVKADAAQSHELSIIMGDIDTFLKLFDVIDAYREDISEVIVELIGNAGEHAKAECLIDIDVTSEYEKAGSDARYHGINIAVVSFSGIGFTTALRTKIEDPTVTEERYTKVREAYEYHRCHLSENYNVDDFFRVAAFQDRITSRPEKQRSGGMGLTKLICSLEKRSDFHRCYMISSSRRLWFRQEHLEYDEDGWIGFNRNNDFFGEIPEASLIENTPIHFPGTAYNLNFVVRKR